MSTTDKVPNVVLPYVLHRVSESKTDAFAFFQDEYTFKFNSSDIPILNLKKAKHWRTEEVVSYLEQRDGVGLSLCGTLIEAMEVSDNKAKRIFKKNPETIDVTFYIHAIPKGTVLPTNLHVSRDEPWEPQMASPRGHHTLNSYTGEDYGLLFIEKVRLLNDEIKGKGFIPIAIAYAAKVNYGQMVRKVVAEGGTEAISSKDGELLIIAT